MKLSYMLKLITKTILSFPASPPQLYLFHIYQNLITNQHFFKMAKWFKRSRDWEKERTRKRVRLLKLTLWCSWAKDLKQLRYVRDEILKEKYEDPIFSQLSRLLNRRQSELYGLMLPLLRPTDKPVKFEKSW
jgi:hypothetical protein